MELQTTGYNSQVALKIEIMSASYKVSSSKNTMRSIVFAAFVLCTFFQNIKAQSLEQTALLEFSEKIIPKDPLINRENIILASKSTKYNSSFEALGICLGHYEWLDDKESEQHRLMIALDQKASLEEFKPINLKHVKKSQIKRPFFFNKMKKQRLFYIQIRNAIKYKENQYVEIMLESHDRQTYYYYYMVFSCRGEYIDYCRDVFEY